MNRDDLDQLLRLKRLREQRAAAALEEARREADRAAAAREQAARTVRAFGVLRRAQESAIYRRLSEAAVTSGKLMAVSANLTDLAAREGALRQNERESERKVRESGRLAEAARSEYRMRQRRAESLDMLSRVLGEEARAEAERQGEQAAEERPPPRR